MRETQHLTLNIADLPAVLDLTGCDDVTRGQIAMRYAAFLVPARLPAFVLRVRVEPGNLFLPRNGSAACHIRAKPDGRITFESHYETGWMDPAAGKGELVMRPQGDLENFLRMVYAWLCLGDHGLLLHACGIIRNERGYVFFGPSDSGKTTIARLSFAHTILSDDLVIVKKNRGAGFRVYGVPFRGDLPSAPRANASADLGALFALVKGTDHHIAPLTVSQSLAWLLACSPFVLTQPANTSRVLDLCRELAAWIPVRALHFRRDPKFWECIDELG